MNCVILQPSYIPWRGYFHQIYLADVFVFYDDVQYDKHGWRNRNRIKTPNGPQWLTIPVLNKGLPPINEISIHWNKAWNEKHFATLRQSYRRAPYFEQYEPLLEKFYGLHPTLLADFTIELTLALAEALGIKKTRFLRSSTLGAIGTRTDRLIDILSKVGATDYLSGPSAQAYIEDDKFRSAGIGLRYMSYNYSEYHQFYPPFDPNVSILDLLFMEGPNAGKHIWG